MWPAWLPWARSKKLLWLRQFIEERVSKNHSDYFWTEVTRSIHRVTSCEFMEWRKCKCSLFSKYVSNLVGCKVTYMYLSTKIYDKKANLASW